MTVSWEAQPGTALALSFGPQLGPRGGNTLVNVSGFNFDSVGQYLCIFGSSPVTASYVSSTLLQCLSPPSLERERSVRDASVPLRKSPFYAVPFRVDVADAETTISNFTEDFLYYSQPKVLALSPNVGNMTGGKVDVIGTGFINTAELSCSFGQFDQQSAFYVSPTKLVCNAPPWTTGSPTVVAVEVSENGVDFTDDEVSFSYNVPFLGGFQLWQLIALITGCVAGAALLIVIIAVCCYRRARKQDKTRRFLDSDTEEEVEPLIQSINSKTMRTVLAQVERVNVEELKIDRRIGRGSFGEVFHAFWAGTEIAVKKLPKHMLSNQKFLEDFAQEISIMAQLRHPNVIQFLGVAIDKVSLYMLTEFMPRGSESLYLFIYLFFLKNFSFFILGSLYDVLHDKEQMLPVELIVAMLLDTARGMSYLHKRLIHRDLKSHNLLVDQHWTVKICDFGLSRLFEPHLNTLTACGTPCWTAPEVLRNERYTEKADVYSFGIVMWECMTREDPFAGMPPFHVVFAVGTQGARPEIPTGEAWPQELVLLMQSCWHEEPEQRPIFDGEIITTLQRFLESDGPKNNNSNNDASPSIN